jgi:hypothetical protein
MEDPMSRLFANSALAIILASSLVGCDALDSAEGIAQHGGAVDGPELPDTPCTDDGDCAGLLEAGGCYIAICDEIVESCTAMPMPNDTACHGEGSCGVIEGVCDGGLCNLGADPGCDDGDPCTEDICTEEFGCVAKPMDEGAPCDDGEPCTVEDACAQGVCGGAQDLENPDCGVVETCGDEVCDPDENCEGCAEDCGPCDHGPECGDGACDGDEPVTCPADCEDAPDPKAECGNGTCEDGESPDNCPEDCEGIDPPEPPTPEDVVECVMTSCGAEAIGCLTDPVCSQSLECLVTCGSDMGCLQGCIDLGAGISEAQLAIIECAVGSGCLDLGGGGGPTGPTCGDGNCDDGEDPQSCPDDCGGDQFGCGDGVCEPWEQWTCPDDCEGGGGECGDGECVGDENAENCPEDCGGGPGECGDGVCGQWEEWTCPEDCEGGGGDSCGDGECEGDENVENCPEDCGGDQWGCGDGVCEQWEEWTCPEDCEGGGGDSCGDGDCDDDENADNCPEDCEGAGGPECGNKTCEEDEGPENCPEDCSPGGATEEETWDCLNGCAPGWCENANGCSVGVKCMAACEGNMDCVEECIAQAPDGVQGTLSEIAGCGQEEQCWGPGDPVQPPPDSCGNGVCDQNENDKICPADCEDVNPPGGGDSTAACLKEHCDTGACFTYPVCTEHFECMADCSTSECAEECIAELGGPAKNVLNGVLACGTEIACWLGGDGTDPGNGTDPPDDGLTECLLDSCGGQYEACMEDDACEAAYPCLVECVAEGGVECTYKCMPDSGSDILLELGQCGGQAGCGNVDNG